MAQTDPWAEFRSGSSPAPVRREDPIVKPADPYRAEDQQMQRDANARAAEAEARAREAEARANEKAQRDRAEWEAKFNVDGTPKNTGQQANEAERKAAAFLIRALGANESYEGQKIGARTLPGQIMADNAPNLLNTLPSAIGNSPARQVADSAQDEFIAASLRQDSGAAIPDQELERQRRIYFPMPGDGPDAIEQKRQARMRAIEGLRQSAGRLEPSAEERYQRMIGDEPAGDRSETPYAAASPRSGRDGYASAFGPLTDQNAPGGAPSAPTDGGQVFDAQLASQIDAMVRRGDSLEQINEFVVGLGGEPVDAGQYFAVRKFLQDNPGYEGSTVNAWRSDPLGHTNLTEADRASPLPNDLIAEGKQVLTDAGAKRGNPIAAGVGDIVEGGINATVGLAANPVGQIAYNLGGYNETYDAGQIVRDALGLPEGDPTIAAINQAAAGGLATGGAAMGLGKIVSGTLGKAFAKLGASPVDDAVTGAGAGVGSEYARSQGYGPAGQAAAAVAGGASPTGFRSLRDAVRAQRGGPPPDLDVIAAGERQNIPIRQPDARPELRGRMAQVETTPHGGPIVREARAADQDAIEQRVTDIGGAGNPSDQYSLGTKVQAAGERYIAKTRAQADRFYETARQEAGGKAVQPSEAVSTIDTNLAELRAAGANSNSGQISYLEGLKEDLAQGDGLTIEAVQNLRTNMRGQLSERGLTGTDADRRVKQVIDAANRDLIRDLPESASRSLRAADDFYRQRQEFISGTLKQFLGSRNNPLAAETAASRLVSMAQGKGNFQRFKGMWGELEPEEQADVAATIAASLGRKANGEFSAATLIRSLDPKQGINPRTAKLVFGDDGARALDDLRVIAKAKTETAQAMNNSRTGVMVNQAAGGFKTLLMGALGFSAGGPGGAAAGAVSREFIAKWGEQRAARTLLNPKFTKWLKMAPNTTDPARIDEYFGKLTLAAAKSPVFSGDVQAFQRALIDSLTKAPAKSAAGNQGDSEAGPQRDR